MTPADQWPPSHLDEVRARYAEWDAWYAGDRNRLESIGSSHGLTDQGSGITGAISRVWRRFWGRAPMDRTTEAVIKVHVPLAADIARASSDLLFAEPPAITADRPTAPTLEPGQTPGADYLAEVAIAQATTDRLDHYLAGGLIGTLAGAAEVCAAMGGVFLRAVVDGKKGRVFATRVDVDLAIPEFDWGQLVRVTFWRELPKTGRGSLVYRWLEIHETIPGEYDNSPADIGVVRHQLYQGTATTLGEMVDLASHPFTARFIDDLDAELGDGISTRTPGLDVVYIPNVTPNALWRQHPTGANLGAPDIAGSEDQLDRLDHTRSSLFEELDLAKARITVPEQWLESAGPGRGLAFANDRRVFTPLNIPPTSDALRAEMFQPEIRVDAHLRIEQQIVEDVLRRASYSPSTFAEDETGGTQTATGVNAKKDRTRLNRARKIRHWGASLTQLMSKMLAMDVAFGFADALVEPSIVSVVFPEAQQTPMELANTVSMWHTAAAASLWTRVATIHPDWDEDQIRTECDRIREDTAADALPDPTMVGTDADPLANHPALGPDVVAQAAAALP